MEKVVLLFLLFGLTYGEKKCVPAIKSGCVQKIGENVLETLLVSFRDGSSESIEWTNFDKSVQSLICKCAQKAAKENYEVFGVQYYGECWGSKKSMRNIARHFKPSSTCIDGSYKQCDEKSGGKCVGTQDSTYIYTIGATDKIDGGYSDWTTWSTCSATCGKGYQDRYRLCNDPSPKNGGESCEENGEPEQVRKCEIARCGPAGYTTATCSATDTTYYTKVATEVELTPSTPFCAVLVNALVPSSKKYTVSVQVYSNEEYSQARIGLMFNVKDLKNYDFIYLHFRSDFYCYTTGSVRNGLEDWRNKKSDQCNRGFKEYQWTQLKLVVAESSATLTADGLLILTWRPLSSVTGRAGVLIRNDFKRHEVFFKDFKIQA
ncbi:uncharacterized protein LOC130654291 isoform X1 [Hydractinia symbiolongicarpus]|uniref:uncharacterized protein LOC130654291 isoform X1 n=1 Tax=Hydractinia symbiolongicarpus TaxID=13093 RepID=UPI00254E870B|nr:uncharacterized protein LOC130654291 isoform X1 [Hydractinia symbiolongicarpus]